MPLHPAPRVSVLMPVRNGIRYLESAVNSILDQTFSDFEFIVVDDGSTDGTPALLAAMAKHDHRIKVIRNEGPHGVAHALNIGLKHCRAEFVARHDVDDLSLPHRLERQLEFMDRHPDIVLLGSWIEMISANGASLRVHGEPLTAAAVRFHSLFGTPFAHPAVMIRRESLDRLSEHYREMPAQDYDLWARMLDAGLRGANLPDVLIHYRVFPASDSHLRAHEHAKIADSISHKQVAKALNEAIEPERYLQARCKQIAHALICNTSFDYLPGDESFGDAVLDLAHRIPEFASISRAEMEALRQDLAARWYPIRAKLAVQSQLARRPSLIERACKQLSRYLRSPSPDLSQQDKQRFIAQVPIIINTRDRVSELQQLLDWLRHAGHQRIILLDNGSSYPPLCDFLDKFDGCVIRLGRNLGHTALWEVPELAEIIRKEWFVYTDPDVLPQADTPPDAVAFFYTLLLKHPRYEKAGFGLKIDDLPDHFNMKQQVIEWETRQYRKEIQPGVFVADIDTTFALYRPGTSYCYGPALRTRGTYEARHLPWYVDSDHPSDEARYYRQHALQNVTTWSGDHSAVARLQGVA